MNRKRDAQSEQGQNVIEFGISLIVAFVALTVIIAGGQLFVYYSAARDAAQKGIDYAIRNPTDTSGIISQIRNASRNPVNLQDTTLVTIPDPQINGEACAGNKIIVKVSILFNIAEPFLKMVGFTQSFPITAIASGIITSPACH